MNDHRKNTNRLGRRPAITAGKLIRWAGIAAIGSGLLFIAVQAVHPLDILSNVTTPRWTIVHWMAVAMGFLGLLGLTGIYARQVEETGWLGLSGYLLLSLFYTITTAYQFIEATISPVLAVEAPRFVESFLGIVTGTSGGLDLGALAMAYQVNGFAGYMLGGVLFGIATLRAGVLPRLAGGLLAVGMVLPLLGSGLVPHPYDRIFAVPVGLALAWLGYALLTERRAPAAQLVPALAIPQTGQAESE
jgi:hypothetical protein